VGYTTLNPKLDAGRELFALVRTLPYTNKDSFTDAFVTWCHAWNDFLKERTVDQVTKRTRYTHRSLHAARTSIYQHLPCLFTYTHYPALRIPNTTNSLDGSFRKVKKAVGIHSGLKRAEKTENDTVIDYGRCLASHFYH